MRSHEFKYTRIVVIAAFAVTFPSPNLAQIVPDTTLGIENTQTLDQNNNVLIEGGARRGGNLFHSFENFSIPTNGEASFNNDLLVERIFGRVTGGSISEIDGLIRLNGNADLFLLNPAGFAFGSNSSFELLGSFIAATAQEVTFSDGNSYSIEVETPSLLSSSIPLGLGFNTHQPITITDVGHTLEGSLFLVPSEQFPAVGLSSPDSGSIAFIGGAINLEGGIVRSPSHIELAAIQSGSVYLTERPEGWSFRYEEGSKFGDINLSRFSFIDGRGFDGALINLQGRNISLTDSSVIYSSRITEVPLNTGIRVVSESLYLDGEIPSQPITFPGGRPALTAAPYVPSLLLVDNFGSGHPGSIEVQSQNVSLTNGSTLTTRSFSYGFPGNISVNANQLDIIGYNSASEGINSSIAANNFGGASGLNLEGNNITLQVNELNILNGGLLGANTFSAGDGGIIVIDSNNILVSGSTENYLFPSQISSSTFQFTPERDLGNAGSISINANSLRVIDGGTLGSSTNNTGNAGDVNIEADYIEVGGGFNGFNNGFSSIGSRALALSPDLQFLFFDSGIQTGRAGTVNFKGERLVSRGGGTIAVDNIGEGAGGNLNIDVENIDLSNSTVSSAVAEDTGGNLNITSSSLFLQDSIVTASAGGLGNGGNIEIATGVLGLVNASRISANAEGGDGGKVTIFTNGLFQDSISSITATSAAGPQFDGTVNIQTPESGLNAATPDSPTFQTPQANPVCGIQVASGRNEFVVTGRGGLPLSPDSLPISYSGWREDEFEEAGRSTPTGPSSTIVEAQGFSFNPDGSVSLVAVPDNFSPLDARLQAQGCVSAETNS